MTSPDTNPDEYANMAALSVGDTVQVLVLDCTTYKEPLFISGRIEDIESDGFYYVKLDERVAQLIERDYLRCARSELKRIAGV